MEETPDEFRERLDLMVAKAIEVDERVTYINGAGVNVYTAALRDIARHLWNAGAWEALHRADVKEKIETFAAERGINLDES